MFLSLSNLTLFTLFQQKIHFLFPRKRTLLQSILVYLFSLQFLFLLHLPSISHSPVLSLSLPEKIFIRIYDVVTFILRCFVRETLFSNCAPIEVHLTLHQFTCWMCRYRFHSEREGFSYRCLLNFEDKFSLKKGEMRERFS